MAVCIKLYPGLEVTHDKYLLSIPLENRWTKAWALWCNLARPPETNSQAWHQREAVHCSYIHPTQHQVHSQKRWYELISKCGSSFELLNLVIPCWIRNTNWNTAPCAKTTVLKENVIFSDPRTHNLTLIYYRNLGIRLLPILEYNSYIIKHPNIPCLPQNTHQWDDASS